MKNLNRIVKKKEESKLKKITMIDKYRKQELPTTQSERKAANSFIKGSNAEKAQQRILNQRDMVQQKFNKIFSMSSEELTVTGPKQKELLKNMQQCFNHNLDITEKQFSLAQRGLVEEQIKFKNFNNYKKKG